ncbi:MAG TPA: LPS export ABC transporter ATP-binding protein [Candidatus Kapabacteria bacterium]|nr:LPS export ABC transporter ATP-binding protein [Candidatus Kapabacteria bacterium]
MKQLHSEHLKKIYGKRTVVKDTSVSVSPGEVVGLLGPNGAGKTTTFYMITGLVKPDGGKVFLDGEDITPLPMYARARKGIGYLPQEASIFRKMTVEENLMAVLELLPISNKERRDKTERLLEELNIAHIRKSAGYMLSGGERRRCEIARSLATDPAYMLLDEPFAGIDPITVEEIMQIVLRLKEKGIGILITDHNVHETLSITDRAYILIDGSIYRAGTAEELANDEEIRRLYLGEMFKLERYGHVVTAPTESLSNTFIQP